MGRLDVTPIMDQRMGNARDREAIGDEEKGCAGSAVEADLGARTQDRISGGAIAGDGVVVGEGGEKRIDIGVA